MNAGELVELRSKIDAYVPAFMDKHGGYGGTFPHGMLALVLANGRLRWVMQDDVGPA